MGVGGGCKISMEKNNLNDLLIRISSMSKRNKTLNNEKKKQKN